MVKIKRGEHTIEVSPMTYEKMFKKLGYELVTSKKAPVKVEKEIIEEIIEEKKEVKEEPKKKDNK